MLMSYEYEAYPFKLEHSYEDPTEPISRVVQNFGIYFFERLG